MDVLVGFVTICYLGHLLTFYLSPDFFELTRILVLWLGLATSNLQMARMMLSLFITFDRLVVSSFLDLFILRESSDKQKKMDFVGKLEKKAQSLVIRMTNQFSDT